MTKKNPALKDTCLMVPQGMTPQPRLYGGLVTWLVLILVLVPVTVHADWEATLKSHFDIVDTFDNDADWTGTYNDSLYANSPLKTDKSATIWQYHSSDHSAVPDATWIGDHGTGYRIGNTGKSLCINYNNFVTPADKDGTGPLLGTAGTSMPRWQANHSYGSGVMIYPAASNGWAYVSTGAGTSGASEPAWPSCKEVTGYGPRDFSGSVTDNGVTWNCLEPAWENWQSNTSYRAGAQVVPPGSPKTGWYYVASNNGTSGSSQPTFPSCGEHSPYSGTVSDNGITWKCGGVTAGWGPTRLSAFFGDGISGKSGYKEIYLFFRVKFAPGFFRWKDVDSRYGANITTKYFDLLPGFTTVGTVGTQAERLTICNNPVSMNACDSKGTSSGYTEYGIAGTVYGQGGGGLSHPNNEFIIDTTSYPVYNDPNWSTCANKWAYENYAQYSTVDMASLYQAGKWISVELHADIGTSGQANGTTELWLYDETGTVIDHYTSGSTIEKIVNFDWYYNKITLGGNRLGDGYLWTEGVSNENRMYIDDFIINGSRIGPQYFSILNGGQTLPLVTGLHLKTQ